MCVTIGSGNEDNVVSGIFLKTTSHLTALRDVYLYVFGNYSDISIQLLDVYKRQNIGRPARMPDCEETKITLCDVKLRIMCSVQLL